MDQDVSLAARDFAGGALQGKIVVQDQRFLPWLPALTAVQIQITLVAISLLGAIVWLGSLWWQPLRLNGYGLIPSLTPAYWIGTLLCAVTFLVAAFKFPRKHLIVGITLTLFAITLYLTPLILEGTARFGYNYVSYGYADYFVRYHEVRPDLFVYHNWPTFHILVGLVVMVGLSPLSVLIAGPILLAAAFITLIWIVAYLTTEDHLIAWVATGVYVVLSQNAYYMVPAALGFLFALTAIALSIHLWSRPDLNPRKRWIWAALILLLGVLTVTTHMLSSVYLVIFMLGLGAFRRLGFAGSAVAPVLALGVIFVAWQVYVATNFTLTVLPGVIKTVLRLDSIYSDTQQFAFTGSIEHNQVVWLRIAVYAAAAGIAGLAWLLELRNNKKPSRKLLIPALAVAAPAATVLVTSYNGEIVGRTVGYAMPFFALTLAYLAHRAIGRLAIIGLVLCITTIYPIYAYGNELIDYVSPSELAATSYVVNHVPGRYHVSNLAPRTTAMGRIEDQYIGDPDTIVTFTGDPYDREARFWGAAPPTAPLTPDCSIPAYDDGRTQVYVCRKAEP